MNTRTAVIGVLSVVAAVVLLIVLKGSDGDEDKAGTGGNAPASAVGKPAQGEAEKAAGERPSGAGAETKADLPTVVVGADGKPVGGVAELSYVQGDAVRFRVESAVADEIHVHGYDLTKDVPAGGSVAFAFPASIEGIFEAELEGRGEQIVELTVEP
jgi:hypothetical protein